MLNEWHGRGSDHRVPRRRQRDRPRRRAGDPRARGRPRGRRHGRRLRQPPRGRRGPGAAGARHRHPHAAELPAGGHRRGEGAAEAPPRHRGGRALAVRRPRLRDRAARRGRRRATPTCSRTAWPRATSSRGPSARSRPVGRCIDPKIVEALVAPVTDDAGLTADDEELLHEVAEGRPIKAIAASRNTTAADVADAVEKLFLKLSEGASTGTTGALKRLRMLHMAIVDREEQGEKLSRLLPGGLADMLRDEGRAHRRDRGAHRHRPDVRHPRLLGHRGAQRPHAARAAAQRAPRGDEPRDHRRGRHGHAVRRRRGDGVLRRAGAARGPRRPRGRRPRSRCSTASAR